MSIDMKEGIQRPMGFIFSQAVDQVNVPVLFRLKIFEKWLISACSICAVLLNIRLIKKNNYNGQWIFYRGFFIKAGKGAGFSLHAGVAAKANERDRLERLCRYISRPAVSEKRLSLTANGNIRYQLKTPYKDGTTHVIFEPLDFIARLAALVPKPRVNLMRLHGVFALTLAADTKV